MFFTDEVKLHGKPSINVLSGSFILDENDGQKFTDIVLGSSTYAGDGPDGKRYVDSINQANRFSITSKGLSLYYNLDSYLLFNPLEE